MFKTIKKRCFIIAEAGINHNGSLLLAYKMIKAAAKTGVDAIKFQIVSPQTDFNFAIKDKKLYHFFSKAIFSIEEYAKIKKRAESYGLDFFVSAADIPSAQMAKKIGVPFIKLSSSNFTNFHLISEISNYNIPIILSTGMANIEDMKRTHRFLKQLKIRKFAFLYCVSKYPAPLKDINFTIMKKMTKLLDIPVGFSDHTEGIISSIIARVFGAVIIEKHFTIDKNLNGPDQKFSLEEKEMKTLVSAIRDTEKVITDNQFKDINEIRNYRFRRSLYANKYIKKGERVEFYDIAAKRPFNLFGIDPRDFKYIVGHMAKKDMKKNALLTKKNIK